MAYQKSILITGGAGFIGSHVVRLFVNTYPHYQIVNLDKLTYAGNLENLKDVAAAPNYAFEKVDIQDKAAVQQVFEKYGITDVIHLAAESHVDRSIEGPMEFCAHQRSWYREFIGSSTRNLERRSWACVSSCVYR